MAYVAPTIRSVGDAVTAADYNIMANDVINLRALANVQSVLLTSSLTQAVTTTFTNLTGMTVSITPTSNTSRILVYCFASVNQDGGVMNTLYRLARDGTGILVGDAAGSRTSASSGPHDDGDTKAAFVILDSPATTSAVTYTFQARGATGNATIYFNRSKTDTNAAEFIRSASTIIVQEIPA